MYAQESPTLPSSCRLCWAGHGRQAGARRGCLQRCSELQIGDLEPEDRIILSVGGNDALRHIDLLQAENATTAKDVLVRLWAIREEFRRTYASLLDRLEHRPVLVLTVYDPCFDGYDMDVTYQQAAECAVAIFDDVIQQEAHQRSFDILELRTCSTTRRTMPTPSSPRP